LVILRRMKRNNLGYFKLVSNSYTDWNPITGATAICLVVAPDNNIKVRRELPPNEIRRYNRSNFIIHRRNFTRALKFK